MDKIPIPPVNIIRIYVFYHTIMLLGYSILLGGFKLGDEVLDMLVLNAKFSRFVYDGDFILDGGHEC